ncbi:hypothetical protein Tco_1133718 [Tanacetum coccineum]
MISSSFSSSMCSSGQDNGWIILSGVFVVVGLDVLWNSVAGRFFWRSFWWRVDVGGFWSCGGGFACFFGWSLVWRIGCFGGLWVDVWFLWIGFFWVRRSFSMFVEELEFVFGVVGDFVGGGDGVVLVVFVLLDFGWICGFGICLDGMVDVFCGGLVFGFGFLFGGLEYN